MASWMPRSPPPSRSTAPSVRFASGTRPCLQRRGGRCRARRIIVPILSSPAPWRAASARHRRGLTRRVPLPWTAVASFGAGAALAAAIIVLTLLPAGAPQLVPALVDDHIRALQPGHLLDVVSTNQHTVKPWFDGKIDFAPPVKDLTAKGFPLLGGRLDYLHGRSVAVLVYSHGKHVVELFVWPAPAGTGEPARASKDGYNLVHWTANGMSFSAVSDLEPLGLEEFARDWRQMP